jgi:hypothetical protein
VSFAHSATQYADIHKWRDGRTGPESEAYFLSKLVWLATHSHRPFSRIQVSVKRPR